MKTTEYTMENGLRVIHNQKEGSGMVDVRLTLKAGSFYDYCYNYTSGISHFVEHLTLSGKTTKYQDSEVLKSVIQNCGGLKNGQTSTRRVCYYTTVLKEFIDQAFDSLSQSVFHSEIDEEVFEKERKIINEERDWLFKRNDQKLLELFDDMSYSKINYYQHPIGTKESLEKISLMDLNLCYKDRSSYDKYLLVVSGDLSFDECKTYVDKYFSTSDKKTVSDTKPMSIDIEAVTKQLLSDSSKKQKTLIVPDKQATVIIGGIMEGFDSLRYFSILLLTNILGTGAPSILNKKLREDMKLLYSISSNVNCNPFFGQFNFLLNVQTENIQTCLDIIKEEIKKIADGNLDEEYIEKSKNRIKSRDIFDNQSMGNEAELLTMVKMNFGDSFKSREEYLDKKISVSREELIDSAKYLLERMSILAILSNEDNVYMF